MRGCLGLKVDRNGWLVVPMQRGPKLVSVQRISPDGQKLFWKDAPTKGATYLVNRPTASLTVVCEGLATALAIYAAVQTSRIIVAFTAGNLSRVTVPVGLAVIAADNDRATEGRTGVNPGVDGARTAAESCGAGVAIPDCRDDETDWCDVRNRMLRERLAAKQLHEREGSIRRAVDAELNREITRQARFVSDESLARTRERGLEDNNRLTERR